jgi:hypothetical protein
MAPHKNTTTLIEACPVCGCAEPLLALGARYDRPHRWRPWITARTDLYLCDRCDAIVTVSSAPTKAPPAIPASGDYITLQPVPAPVM